MSSGPDMQAIEDKVRGSSFYAAMKLMSAKQKAAMFAIYAFCREVDDIADDLKGDRADRAKALQSWRADIASLYRGEEPGQAAYLVEAVNQFDLEQEDFLAIIDGMAMDVEGDIVAPDRMTLDLYCDRVASAVGRLSVKVFGMERQPGIDLSHHLGRALQLTNILRDLDEDAAIGRLYLSKESLDAAGITETSDPMKVIADPRIEVAARVTAATARVHYAAADKVMRGTRKGSLRAPRLMRAAYGLILERMQKIGWIAPRRRVSLNKFQKLWVVIRYGLTA